MPPSPRRSSLPNNPGAGGGERIKRSEPGGKPRTEGQSPGTETKARAESGGPERARGRNKRPEFAVQPSREPDDAISEISGPAIGERTTTVLSSRYGRLPKPPPENSTLSFDRDFFAVFFCTCSWPFLFSAPPRNSTGAIHHSKPLRRFRGANLCVNLCSDTPHRLRGVPPVGGRSRFRTDAVRGGKALPFPPLAALPVGG